MSAQLSVDNFSSYSKGSLPSELAAAVYGMQSVPLHPYHTFAGLDVFAQDPTARHSISGYPSPGYQYAPHDQHDTFLPPALSGSNLALHDALTSAYMSAQLDPQRPPSPQVHYPLRWPEADTFSQYLMVDGNVNPALAHHALQQNSSIFPPPYSLAPQSTYQTLPDAQQAAAQPAWSVSGSLDPVTGIFQRTTEHPRLRTAQACEKCRTRKAKCSGEHPSCQRCRSRGLVCEYAPERRMRGPNKKKRESVSSDPLDERRGSVISVASTSSTGASDLDTYRFPDIPSADHASSSSPSHGQSPRAQLPSARSPRSQSQALPGSVPPSPYASNGASPLSPPPSIPAGSFLGRRGRPRPPPLNLGGIARFDASAFLPRPLPTPEPAPHSIIDVFNDITPTYAARRQSLPAYLLHNLAPTPPALPGNLDREDEGYTHSRSNSTSTSEAPLTPLTGPASGLFTPAELEYPDGLGIGYPEETLVGFHEVKESVESQPAEDTQGRSPVDVTGVDITPVDMCVSTDVSA